MLTHTTAARARRRHRSNGVEAIRPKGGSLSRALSRADRGDQEGANCDRGAIPEGMQVSPCARGHQLRRLKPRAYHSMIPDITIPKGSCSCRSL